MQVDGEILFTNKGQEWSKNVKKFKIACSEVNILRSRSPKGQKRPKTITI